MALGLGRALTLPLLLLNFAMYVVVLGLASHFLNNQIGDGSMGGNAATLFMVIFALIAGVVGIASVLAGFHHLRVWRSESLAATSAITWVSWVLLLLAMGLAWKEIRIGGRSTKHRVLEAFLIVLSFTHLLYLILLNLGIFGHKYGPVYGDPALPLTEPKITTPVATTSSPAAASAV